MPGFNSTVSRQGQVSKREARKREHLVSSGKASSYIRYLPVKEAIEKARLP